MGGATAESRCGFTGLLLDKTHTCKHPLDLYWMCQLHPFPLLDLLDMFVFDNFIFGISGHFYLWELGHHSILIPPLERRLHGLLNDILSPPSTIFSPSRSRARSWQPSGFRCHPRRFPSVLDSWWRGLRQLCPQNQRYQKAVWTTGNNPTCPRTYQGHNRSQRGHWIRNWTLWNKPWKAIPASQCYSNNRYRI